MQLKLKFLIFGLEGRLRLPAVLQQTLLPANLGRRIGFKVGKHGYPLKQLSNKPGLERVRSAAVRNDNALPDFSSTRNRNVRAGGLSGYPRAAGSKASAELT